jgi:hypothetical protein
VDVALREDDEDAVGNRSEPLLLRAIRLHWGWNNGGVPVIGYTKRSARHSMPSSLGGPM